LFDRCKENIKLKDEEKKKQRIKFYRARVKYMDCVAGIKNKDQEIRKRQVYQMHCNLRCLNNQRLAGRYKVKIEKKTMNIHFPYVMAT